jgi:hypothetical protein
MDIVVVDLDSTLCDTRHRQDRTPSKVGGTWTDYSLLCAEDSLVHGVAELVRMLRTHSAVYILSGRNDEAEQTTRDWLKRHEVQYDGLRLRPSSWNSRPVWDWKVTVIKEWQAAGLVPKLFIDDWPEMCLQVELQCSVPVLCVTPLGDPGL